MLHAQTEIDDKVLEEVAVPCFRRLSSFHTRSFHFTSFEPRYRTMLDGLPRFERARSSSPSSTARGRINEYAGAGVITEHNEAPDGRSNIIVSGAPACGSRELVFEDPPRYPYKRARATLVTGALHCASRITSARRRSRRRCSANG